MSTKYSEFLPNTEDPSTESGPIFRNPQAMEGLKTGLEGDEKNMYAGFLRGKSLTKTGNCLGYRQNPQDPESPYTWISYDEVSDMIDKLSSEMMQRGLCEDTKDSGLPRSGGTEACLIGIYSKTRYEWLVAEYACYRCNATVVTLYDSLGVDATKYILNLTMMETIICGEETAVKVLASIKREVSNVPLKTIIFIDPLSDDLLKELESLGITALSFKDMIANCTTVLPPRECNPSDICTICFTSGTTGNPKGVIVSHQTLLSLTLSINQHFNIFFKPTDVVVAYLPLAHMFERFVEANAMFNGAAIGYWSGSVPSLVSDLKQLQPTAFCAVPRILQRIQDTIMSTIQKSHLLHSLFMRALKVKTGNLAYNKTSHWFYDLLMGRVASKVGLQRCRWILTGSAPVSNEVIQFFECVFSCAVLNGYGMTETAGGTCCSSDLDVTTVGHCGAPVSGIEGKIVSVPEKKYSYKDTVHYMNDNDKQEIPVCGRGELCFRGPGVFSGYFKNKEATEAAFDKDGWFHTGDIGFVNRDTGSIQVIDRIKNIFKLSQGEYVAVEKVENVYVKNPLVDQIFIYGDSKQNYIVGVIVPSKKELMDRLRENKIIEESVLDALSFDDICQKPEVRKYVLEEINQTALDAKLFGFERVRNIHLEPKEWSVANNMLSPSMKLKRHVTQETYKEVISDLYMEGRLI